MTDPSTSDPDPDLDRRALLFAPGLRVGWVFRDRWRFVNPFPDPEPAVEPVPDTLLKERDEARRRHSRRASGILTMGGVVLPILLLLSGYTFAVSGFAAALTLLLLGLGLIALLTAVVVGPAWWRRSKRAKAVAAADDLSRQRQDESRADWHSRKSAFDDEERERVDRLMEWGPAQVPSQTLRLDLFGGNLWSWTAFLTVYGASALVERPVVVLDLSREFVSGELAQLAAAAGVPVDTEVLPDQLRTSRLLSDLPAGQVVDALVESMYGGEDTAQRADRSTDDRILTALCRALGTPLTLGRIAAGLRALMDEPDPAGQLSPAERNHIADELFSYEYRRQAGDQLRRLESYIHPLEELGAERVVRDPGYFTCFALASEGRNVRGELLTDLTVQWLIHRIAADDSAVPDVVIAGADEIATRHLDRLADACERRGVRLTLMFRHLRKSATEVMGGGAVGFMRLGNTAEANQAADYIGRQHRFVLTQLTRTLGGNETHTTGDTDGESYTAGINVSNSVGWTKGKNTGTSRSERVHQFFDENASESRSTGTNTGKTTTETYGDNRSWARNWSRSRSYAEGTNWSDAESRSRVYEYAVEPTQLQHLPDHAMLLVHSDGSGSPVLVPVELDPAIVTLPRVSTDPLPEPPPASLPTPPPQVAEALHPPLDLTTLGQPGEERVAADRQRRTR